MSADQWGGRPAVAPDPAAMADSAAFARYYETDIRPPLMEMESRRRRGVRRHNTFIGVGVALGLVGGAGSTAAFGSGDHTLAIPGVSGVLGWIAGRFALQGVATDTKAHILDKVSRHLDVRYSQTVAHAPGLQEIRERRLIPGWDRASFEDLFQGERQGANFMLYEAHLERQTRDSKGRTRWSTVFRGQLLQLRFPRDFTGITTILRDKGLFNFTQSAGKGLERARLVDPDFEKTFEVFTTDQVEARYLLTPSFMERLLTLETLLQGKSARASFSGGSLFIAIEGGNLFEAGSMFTPLDDVARARRVYDDIKGIHNIVDALIEGMPEAVAPVSASASTGEAPSGKAAFDKIAAEAQAGAAPGETGDAAR